MTEIVTGAESPTAPFSSVFIWRPLSRNVSRKPPRLSNSAPLTFATTTPNLLQPITCRDLSYIPVVIELANQPRIDQLFNFDVGRLGTLHGHKPVNIAQRFE